MNTFDLIRLKAELERDEGRRAKPYRCTAGKLTIGVGWNLDERGLPTWMIDKLFDLSIQDAEQDARALIKNFDDLTPVRQRVIMNMAFNMGRDRLKGFRKMIGAVHCEDWGEAAEQLIDSEWYREFERLGSKRARRLVKMMREG